MKITLTKIGREIEEKHKFKNLTVREKLLIHATILVVNEQVLKHKGFSIIGR